MPSSSLDRHCQGGIARRGGREEGQCSFFRGTGRRLLVERERERRREGAYRTSGKRRESYSWLRGSHIGERERRRAFKSARTHIEIKRTRARPRVFFRSQFRETSSNSEVHRGFYPAESAMGSRGDVNARGECGEGERSGHQQHEDHLFLVLLQESPRPLRMTVSARIHLRTRDLSANRLVTPEKRRCGRESDITMHQNSPHLIGASSRDDILMIGQSYIFIAPVDIRGLNLRSDRGPLRGSPFQLVADFSEEPAKAGFDVGSSDVIHISGVPLFTDKRISLDEEEGEQESLQFEQQTGRFLRRKAGRLEHDSCVGRKLIIQ
ncbi:hypothetical protein ALC62_00614 [Cyphomyrmex costatus]|uniref:Uncharacterized protein n=1 Tax=Cyphomyrmex costatus TaxID=456900 RepID=A0A151IQJ0_9HYME|nr:hypothetical protein ALC62_00614 [Cyphomyrmex costatus]